MNRDMQEIRTSIRLIKQEIEANSIRNENLEKELVYLKEDLKNQETEIAKEGCRARNIRAQFRMQKLKERLQTRPPTKSTISEIITTEKVDGKNIETKHRMQCCVQKQIEIFYKDLYGYKSCRDSLEDIEQFLGETKVLQVTEKENSSLKEEIKEEEVKNSCSRQVTTRHLAQVE